VLLVLAEHPASAKVARHASAKILVRNIEEPFIMVTVALIVACQRNELAEREEWMQVAVDLLVGR
jgi:hypothetical protein